MGFIRTVCGDIAPEDLGVTSMHEHTITNNAASTSMFLKMPFDIMRSVNGYRGGADIKEERQRRKNENLIVPQMSFAGAVSGRSLPQTNPARELSDVEYYANELKAFQALGGEAMCDCSPYPSSGHKLADVHELSRASGVHIVSAVGYYTNASLPRSLVSKGQQGMMDELIPLLENGEPDSGVKPGFLKCAVATLSGGEIISSEMTAVRSCAVLAKHYDMALHIHTQFPLRKVHLLSLADELERLGLDPERVIFCHMDSYNLGSGNPAAHINERGYDIELPLTLAKRGFNIGLDTWCVSGKDQSLLQFNIEARKAMLLELLEKGCAGHITLGHDLMSKAAGIQNGGCGYTRWPDTMAALRDEGKLTSEDYRQITVLNPMRILTISAGK